MHRTGAEPVQHRPVENDGVHRPQLISVHGLGHQISLESLDRVGDVGHQEQGRAGIVRYVNVEHPPMPVEGHPVANQGLAQGVERDHLGQSTLAAMTSRAMIVVGGGASTRFGKDKLMAEVAGKPLISRTIDAIVGQVDVCVVACRPELIDDVARLHPDVIVTAGGATRTASEIAGVDALAGELELIGVHDAARPAVSPDLVRRLFDLASVHGGAVPVLTPDRLIVERRSFRPVGGLGLAQTPQVFRGPELVSAYAKASERRFVGHDTVDVLQRFGDLQVVAVAGEEDNVKVTYPADLERVRALLADPSRT